MEYMSLLQDELDEAKPSLFELLSEQQLAALLPPTIRYLLVVATQRYPRYLLRILNSYDEVYAVLDLAVQRHFLRNYGGGFTENFYGLKRERVLRIRGGQAARTQTTPAAAELMRESLRLTNADVWKNLAVMVGVPYIKRKLDEAYEIHAPQVELLLGAQYNGGEGGARDGGGTNIPTDVTWRQRLQFYFRWFLRNIYPSLNAAYYFSMLAFNLAYLFSNTAYSSPFLWLIQTRIRRLGAADFAALKALDTPKPTTGGAGKPLPKSSLLDPRNFTTAVLPRLLSSLRILLPTSIFALKFLEWWHASDFARQLSRKAAEGLELPPPVVAGQPNDKWRKQKEQQQDRKNSSGATEGNGANSDVQPGSPGSRRRSSLKKKPTSSVSLADRPSTPPGRTDGDDVQSPSWSAASSPSSPSRVRKTGGQSFSAPIAASSGLPILTVARPTNATSALCPICVKPMVTPTAAQTGFVYCYTCIFRWVQGTHDRQEAWMRGEGGEEGWGEDDDYDDGIGENSDYYYRSNSTEAVLDRTARQAAGGHALEDITAAGSTLRSFERQDPSGEGDKSEKAAVLNNASISSSRGLRSRVGRWESGVGRDAVTGRRVLGGTDGLRRVMV